MLEDLIKAAVSAAQDKAATAAAEAMNELTGGMPLPPGMDGLLW
jgi:DNA-binding protein YbaB